MGDSPYVLVVAMQPGDATTALFFDHLEHRAAGAHRVVRAGSLDVWRLLARASAVILVRGLFELGDVARCARRLGIPVYWFLDDNFMSLQAEGGAGAAFLDRYSMEAVRRELGAIAGVLVSSPSLAQYFLHHGLHRHVQMFPPVSPPEVTRTVPSERFRVAFFGGRHLHVHFRELVLPALRRLALERPVTLVAVGLSEEIVPSEGLRTLSLPYQTSYRRGVAALAAHGVDVLVHPVAPGSDNNRFKNPHALITARMLGAVPVVSTAPPYEELVTSGTVTGCGDSTDAWFHELSRQAASPRLRTGILQSVSRYCDDHFDGRRNSATLQDMHGRHRQPPHRTAWARSLYAAGFLVAGRLFGAVTGSRGGPGAARAGRLREKVDARR
jgi:hypothetical protein